MSCHGCASKFSIFSKEISCPSCGFSYCSNCLKQRTSKDNQQQNLQNLCKNCIKKLTAPGSSSESDMDPPVLLLKRLENLQNPAKPPITLYRKNQSLSYLKQGLSTEDKAIVDRLEKLKENPVRTAPADEEEIRRRLAVLQGKDGKAEENIQPSFKPNNKSDQEQVDCLLQQYIEETNLKVDTNIDVQEIEEKLRKLRGLEQPGLQRPRSHTSESDNGDKATARIVKKALEEAKLEKRLGYATMSDEDITEPEPDESEMPWCSICNEDAILRCLGCDGELYCSSCFKEGHDYFEMKDHKTVPFSETKKKAV